MNERLYKTKQKITDMIHKLVKLETGDIQES